MRLTLLGPQRRPTLGHVVHSLYPQGPIAMITAGWREREADDGELRGLLDSRAVDLSLYQRWLDVQERDPWFAAAERRLQGMLDEVQEIYLLRLDHALRAAYAIQHHAGTGQFLADALTEAVAAVRELDAAHLHRVNDIHAEFRQDWQPHARPVIAEHRAAVARRLASAAALVVAGGHVGVLTDTLHLFGVATSLRSPVIAWSAGAMALTERVVLFHDRSPQGPGHPELYGRGLGVLPSVVALPHARSRLLLDTAPRMAVLARRFAPARCILLENGTRVDTDSDGSCPPGTRVLSEKGRVTSLEAA